MMPKLSISLLLLGKLRGSQMIDVLSRNLKPFSESDLYQIAPSSSNVLLLSAIFSGVPVEPLVDLHVNLLALAFLAIMFCIGLNWISDFVTGGTFARSSSVIMLSGCMLAALYFL